MVELARLIRAREVSPVEVVQAHLDRIASLDGTLRSYITVMSDSALPAAKAAEAAATSGETLGPLHGVPVGLKDLYCTKGVKTTGGSRILSDWAPPEVRRDILGHSDIRLTENVYTHVYDEAKQRAADAMDRLFPAAIEAL